MNYELYYYYVGTKNDTWESATETYVQGKLTEWGYNYVLHQDTDSGDGFHRFGWGIENSPTNEQYQELQSYIHTNISNQINQY